MTGRVRTRLTDALIARLRPRDREYTVWDTRVAGLGVRVRPSGSASFVLLRNAQGRTRRVALGPAASRGVDEVRRACHALLAAPASNEAADTTHRAPSFRDFVAGPWRDACFSRYKPSTRRGVNSVLRRQLLPAFGPTALNRITRDRVLRWFDAYSQRAPGGANSALGVLRQILNHAIARGHAEANPARDIKTNRRRKLTRFLSRDEIRRLHIALDAQAHRNRSAGQQADIIRLLLFTGCRHNEIRTLRWPEVNGRTLVLADSKTGHRSVPLNIQARHVLERQPRGRSEYVFPSMRNGGGPCSPGLPLWYMVRKQAGIEDVRLHDLRHTVASHAVMSGVAVPVVSRLLGNSDLGMTLRYAHLAETDIEAAAERIGAALARVMAAAGSSGSTHT